MTDYLKCRFCNWKTKAWTTNKKGQRRNGYPKLQNHFVMEHPEEYKDIVKKCNERDRFEGNDTPKTITRRYE